MPIKINDFFEKYKPVTGETCWINVPVIDNCWHQYKVEYIGEFVAVISTGEVKERTVNISEVYFRKVIDPIDEMLKVVDGLNDNYDCCKALYDAGYRKTNKDCNERF